MSKGASLLWLYMQHGSKLHTPNPSPNILRIICCWFAAMTLKPSCHVDVSCICHSFVWDVFYRCCPLLLLVMSVARLRIIDNDDDDDDDDATRLIVLMTMMSSLRA